MDQVLHALPYIVGILALVMIRVLKVFTDHQQKMAEILNRTSGDHADIAALRKEIAEMKSMMQSHVTASEGIRAASLPPQAELSERLGSGT